MDRAGSSGMDLLVVVGDRSPHGMAIGRGKEGCRTSEHRAATIIKHNSYDMMFVLLVL